MNRQNTHKSSRSQWLNQPIAGGCYQHWLTDNSSLTQKLQQQYIDITVRPLINAAQKPWFNEAQLLQIKPNRLALVREVLLMHELKPLVFAHSVIPHKSLRGAWLGLSRLGNQPLGAVLFANPKVRRTRLTYKKLIAKDALYQRAIRQLTARGLLCQPQGLPNALWARRSIFSLNCAKILVTEVFLPTLLLP